MKRQFKPNNKVKHFENKAKRYLSIGKWWEQRHSSAESQIKFLGDENNELENRIKELKEVCDIYQESSQHWFDQHKELFGKWRELRDRHNKKLIEHSKVLQSKSELEKDFDRVNELCEFQKVTFQKVANEDFYTITKLQTDLMSTKRWLFASSIGLFLYVGVDLVRFFV